MQFSSRGRAMLLAGAVALAAAADAGAVQRSDDPRAVALRHIAQTTGVTDVTVTSQYRSGHSGVTHVNLNQTHRGLEVFGAHATVNVADGRVVFASDGTLVPGLRGQAQSARLGAPAAVAAAARGLGLGAPTDLRVLSRGNGPARRTTLSRGGISEAPIPARLGYEPAADGPRLAWQLTIDDVSDAHLWNATVDARTGELLDVDDWTSHDSHADLEQTLSRGDGGGAFASPFPVADGSSYRAFQWPAESPIDGPRSLVTDAADGDASPFGWHDADGAEGAEFTITRGNNVHAYLDQDADNAPDFGATDGGPGLDFDFALDLGEHAQNNRDAGVANLFYANNVMHDVLYRYGFDEAAGNFQASNYGRGGGEGDYVRAEAADGRGTNNANFSTPAEDGGEPRMQMYLWPGNQFGPQNQVTVDGAGSFGAGWARFTPAPTRAGLAGRALIHGRDGCTRGRYGRDVPSAGWIAVVDGDEKRCSSLERVQTAEALGADAVVVARTDEGSAPVLTGSMDGPPVGIPAVSVTQADGAAIKSAIADGSATGGVRKHPDHPGIRDGDLDNGIVIHEYGHGVSNRLTGGPGVNCLTGDERAGEGWSDFLSITLLLDPALDDPEAARGMVPYILFQNSRNGSGLRPRPYSRNMEIQPFTYDSIKTGGWLNGSTLATPHGLGHGWAAVLWDMTWDLIDKHGFNPNVYEPWNSGGNNRALQYVLDGLKFQGCGPGLVVARDAIIAAADTLSEGEDTCTVWASFARRGLGYSAVQGTTNRNDNQEAFDSHPECRRPFQAPIAGQPALNTVKAGETVPLRFTAAGFGTGDLLATNSPYSRLVDCQTLQTVGPGAFITPRPTPLAAQTPGGSALTLSSDGVFQYPWKTLGEWSGTCREFVLTRADGRQHRAYFRFR